MEEHILFFLKSNNMSNVNDSILWESLKAVMRGQIISYTSAKHRTHKQALKNTETNIHQLEEIYQSPPTRELLCKVTK